MKNDFKLLSIGFSPDINEKILNLVKKSHLGVTTYDSLMGATLSLLEVKLNVESTSTEYDLIIVNSLGFQGPVIEVIQYLKGRFPLVEVLLISFKQNYQMAINAFRGGVRDILEYPLKEEEFLSSLGRSLTYRSLFQRSENLTKILGLFTLFGDYRQFESKEHLFSRIDEFLRSKFSASGHIILSMPEMSAQGKKTLQEFSIFWNQELYEKEFIKKNRQDFLHSLNLAKFREPAPHFLQRNVGQEMYYIFNLGQWEKNQYVGVFKVAEELEAEMMGYLGRILYNAFQQILYLSVEKELSQLVHCDDVTGLYNQRRLQVDIEKCMKQYQIDHHSFSLLFIDIDHFKRINDSSGHMVGSLILAEVASELKKVVRETDLIYRYGGDEFVIILQDTEKEFAQMVGQRILNTLKLKNFNSTLNEPEASAKIKISVSIGVAEYPLDANSKEEILEIADRMMYEAKEAGRGQVRVAKEFFKVGQ